VSNNWFTYLNILEKRLYQLIIARLNGDRIESQGYQKNIIELVKKGIGGFILFGGEKDKDNFLPIRDTGGIHILYLQGTARYMNLLL